MVRKNSNFQKAINETIYTDMRGLTAALPNVADPSSLVIADNFYISRDGVFNTRPGFEYLTGYRFEGSNDETSESDTYIDFVNRNSASTVLMISKGTQLFKYDDNTNKMTKIENGTSVTYDIFDSKTGLKDVVQFGGNLIYIQGDGNSNKARMYIMSGLTDSLDITNNLSATTDFSSITSGYIDLPKADVYGNPVSVTSLMGRLYVITDKGYLRYSAISNPAVWEERVLMLGTVSGTASLDTILGTGTAFTQTMVTNTELAPGAGVRLYITDGTNSEYVTIESITDATNLTLTTNLVNTYIDASYFIIGIDFQEPVAPNDGLKCRMIRKFGNLLAISRTSEDQSNSSSDMMYCGIKPIENSYIVSVSMKALGGSFDIHPYSLFELEDNLIFVSSDGIYRVKGSSIFNEGRITPEWLSQNKLENVFRDLNMSKKNNTRVSLIRNRQYKLLVVSTTYKGSTHNNQMYVGYMYRDGSYEFTKFSALTYSYEGVYEDTFKHLIPYKDYALLITNRALFKSFDPDDWKYSDGTYAVTQPLASSDSTEYNMSSGADIIIGDHVLDTDFAGATGAYSPLIRRWKTGNFSLDHFDKIKLNKASILTSELAPESGADYFNVSLVIDNLHTVVNKNKTYEGVQTIPIKLSATDIFLGDTDIFLGDGYSGVYSTVKPYKLYALVNYADSISMEVTDTLTTGALEIRGWGVTYLKGKYSG